MLDDWFGKVSFPSRPSIKRDLCWTKVSISIIPHPISDSIWLTRGSLLIGAGHLLSLYGQPKTTTNDRDVPESLFEHVARHNGPLDDYHPQLVLQCLLWGTTFMSFVHSQTYTDIVSQRRSSSWSRLSWTLHGTLRGRGMSMNGNLSLWLSSSRMRKWSRQWAISMFTASRAIH